MTGFLSRLRGPTSAELFRAFEVPIAKAYLRLFPDKRYRCYAFLARLMDAEIDARTALEKIHEILTNDGRNPGEFDAVAVSYWLRGLREHGQLSEALNGWVPQSEVLLIEAGMLSGKFQRALSVMLSLNERVGSIRGQIFGKLAYPVCLLVLLGGIVHFLSTAFLPPIVAIKGDRGDWTGLAASTVGFLTWVPHGLVPSAIAVLALLAAIFVSLPHFRGPVRVIFDRLPPWSVHRFIAGTTFLTALLVLMESGRGLVDAITLIKPNATPYLAEKIEHIERAMREGDDFGKALAHSGDNFPDRELIKEIQIFSHIGKLDKNLFSIVEKWMETATTRTLRLISMVGMILLFAAFSQLGFVMSGIYDIIAQIKQGY